MTSTAFDNDLAVLKAYHNVASALAELRIQHPWIKGMPKLHLSCGGKAQLDVRVYMGNPIPNEATISTMVAVLVDSLTEDANYFTRSTQDDDSEEIESPIIEEAPHRWRIHLKRSVEALEAAIQMEFKNVETRKAA